MNLEPNPPPPLLPTTLLLSTCNLHPDEQHPGFCASCLRERLAGLESSSSISTATTSHRKIINASALKSIFRVSTTNNSSNKAAAAAASSSSSSFLPELRRCKSFSGRKAEGFSGAFEPQRKSCDVRARNTLWNLFNKDNNERKNKEICEEEEEEIEVEVVETIPNSGLLRVVGDPVLEETRDEVEEEEEDTNGEEIRVSNVNVSEVVQVIEEEEEVITMKDHIDHDNTNNNKKPSGRDLKDIAGSFWVAASVFSKKLQKWRRKQKMKKSGTGTSNFSRNIHNNKPQSEIADYGYGRRSCDVDPRYSLDAGRMSLDAGRMSFDDPRYSWDEPRASWDGYLIGRTFPRLAPMVSVVEDLPPPPPPPPPPPVIIMRSDNQIPVEEPLNSSSNDDTTPGGSVQTRDYYSDSSQRRRKSFERSTSMRKKAAAVGAEVAVEEDHETKPVSNAKVSPAAVVIDQLPGPKLIGTDRDLRDSKSNSLRDDRSESFESAFRDSSASISGGLDQKGLKKSSRWSKAWNIWGLIHKRNVGGKEDEEERYSRGNVVERSYSESWQDLRRDVNGELRRDVNGEAAAKGGGGFNRGFRSNSSVSSRHSFNTGTQFGGSMRSNAETNGHGKKRKEEVVLERSRSARYSPNDVDNGLLRFYLTPLRNRRNGSVKNNSKPPKNTYSIARSVLRLY